MRSVLLSHLELILHRIHNRTFRKSHKIDIERYFLHPDSHMLLINWQRVVEMDGGSFFLLVSLNFFGWVGFLVVGFGYGLNVVAPLGFSQQLFRSFFSMF